MSTKPLESVVEDYFKKMIKKVGGLPMKFTSPGKRGVPDQIVLFGGITYFVEIKRPGEKPRPSQVTVHKQFQEKGVSVYTVDSQEQVNEFITEILKQPLPRTRQNKETTKQTIRRDAFVAPKRKKRTTK